MIRVVRGLVGLRRRDGYLVETRRMERTPADLQAAHYDVILCDVRMPELDGVAFYAVLLAVPSLCHRVIFLTGDTLSVDSMAFVHQSGRPRLPKPCSAAELRKCHYAGAAHQRTITEDRRRHHTPSQGGEGGAQSLVGSGGRFPSPTGLRHRDSLSPRTLAC